jgi:hypothetical protein
MEPDHLCRGLTTANGYCTKSAGWGTRHVGVGRCKLHGGSAPSSEVAGAIYLARREYQVMGIPINITPLEALLECIRITAGEVAYASNEIARLEPADAVGQIENTVLRPRSLGKDGEDPSEPVQEIRTSDPQLHIWIRVRQLAMDRLVSYSATAIKAGVDIALVQIAEETAQRLALAVAGILADLGVRDHPNAPAIVRKHLQVLNAGASSLQAA